MVGEAKKLVAYALRCSTPEERLGEAAKGGGRRSQVRRRRGILSFAVSEDPQEVITMLVLAMFGSGWCTSRRFNSPVEGCICCGKEAGYPGALPRLQKACGRGRCIGCMRCLFACSGIARGGIIAHSTRRLQ